MLMLPSSFTKSNTLIVSTPFFFTSDTVISNNPGLFSPCRRGEHPFLRHQSSPQKNRELRLKCSASRREHEGEPPSRVSPYDVLGVDPLSSLADIKAAFRAKVKEFHPDVCKDAGYSDAMIRHVIQAYKMLLEQHESETIERECVDPFEEPECDALDLFVNEFLCIGRGCPYSCVARAPHAFKFDTLYGTARAVSQGSSEDYQVQLAVGQCPRSCIHYVTPSQKVILEELLESVLNSPCSSAEAGILDSLIAKARFENNRYSKPKKKSKTSNQFVDWL